MKNHIVFIIFSCFFVLSACKKDQTTPLDTTSFSFSFAANYDGEPLIMNEKEYEYNGNPIRFSKVNFYLSDISLGDTEVLDIGFIDLTKTHTSEVAAKVGTTITFPKTPVGEYPTLAFGVGVAPDLNRTKPSNYSTSHPLGSDNSSEYWEAWNSYIFLKIEGQYDSDGNGFDADDVSFAYHVGQDDMYENLSTKFEQPLILLADTPKNIAFRLDIKKLLIGTDGELLPLQVHDPNNQKTTMRLIMDNFSKALKYVR